MATFEKNRLFAELDETKCTLPVKYPGSHMLPIRMLEPYFPFHRHHVSVYGGSSAEILGKRKASYLETYNDLSFLAVNFFLHLRYHLDELVDRINRLPFSKYFFELAKKTLRSTKSTPLDLAEAFVLVGNQSRGNADPAAKNVSWALNYKAHKNTTKWQKLPSILTTVSERFKKVQLTNWSWEQVLEVFDSKETFFTVDPPFFPSTLASTTPLYRHIMTEKDHERLLIKLHAVKGSWILFGYDNPLYQKYLAGNKPFVMERTCNISRSSVRPVRHECAWFKY